MSTYLQICQDVRAKSGLQGTGPSAVATAVGLEAILVSLVKDAYLDVQNFRTDWRWLRERVEFTTTAGSTEMSLTEILGSGYRFRDWWKYMAYVEVNGQWKRLRYINYDLFTYRVINQDAARVLSYYTVRPADYAILYPETDANYDVRMDYQKSPQVLTADADIPEMPTYFHNLITYAGVEKTTAHIGNPGVYDQYAQEQVRLTNALMREQLPKKDLCVRGIA